MLADQIIERRNGHFDYPVPDLIFPARRTMRGDNEIGRCGCDGRIGRVDLQFQHADLGAAGCRDKYHLWITVIDRTNDPATIKLWLKRNHPRTETPKAGNPIANVAANIEGQISF